eukprot:7560556-Alexandrium_andersonii.AAC.1
MLGRLVQTPHEVNVQSRRASRRAKGRCSRRTTRVVLPRPLCRGSKNQCPRAQVQKGNCTTAEA